jgi:hypothetical protein
MTPKEAELEKALRYVSEALTKSQTQAEDYRIRLVGALEILAMDGMISSGRARELAKMTIGDQREFLRTSMASLLPVNAAKRIEYLERVIEEQGNLKHQNSCLRHNLKQAEDQVEHLKGELARAERAIGYDRRFDN